MNTEASGLKSSSSTPLWRQLQAAAKVLAQVRDGTSGTAALDAVPKPLRAATQSLSFTALRHLGRALALRELLVSRTPPPAVDALLLLALSLAWNPNTAPYEIFTLVDQTVEAAKRGPAKAQAGFINACLRRFLRERDALVQGTQSDLQALWNHPLWWLQRLQTDYPDGWQAILLANNAQAPMTLRVNPRKASVAQYRAALADQGRDSTPVGESGLILAQACPVDALPGFEQGWVSVQDAAAQLAAPLLLQDCPAGSTWKVLDACAAPGGKTAHLLELGNAQVTALDVDPKRCERMALNLKRLGLSARMVVADAACPDTWWQSSCQGELFDAILLDAPCSASGIVRRHPDVRWLRRASDIAQLAQQQARLLSALWPLLKPGGRLLYCTCSVFHAEGQDQIQAFVEHNSDAQMRPAPGHLAPQNGANPGPVPDNAQVNHDGFFYALLQKRLA